MDTSVLKRDLWEITPSFISQSTEHLNAREMQNFYTGSASTKNIRRYENDDFELDEDFEDFYAHAGRGNLYII